MNKEKFIIWDLHWNKKAFQINLEKYDLVNEKFDWQWWNSDLFFLWDIIWDRNKQWLEILIEINKIKFQVEDIWWNFWLIAWNHEDYLFSFLGNLLVEWKYHPIDIAFRQNQWIWLEELLEQFSDNIYNLVEIYKKWDLFSKKITEEILYNMNNSENWKKILETMLEYNLLIKSNNILLHHTNTTPDIVNLLNKYNFITINSIYKNWLEDILINNKKPKEEFFEIRDIFLKTNNRNYFW